MTTQDDSSATASEADTGTDTTPSDSDTDTDTETATTDTETGMGDLEPRTLYPFSFGGLDEMSAQDSVDLLMGLGYPAITVKARSTDDLARLNEYLTISEAQGEDFTVVSAFIAHRFDQYGLSNADHLDTIDALAQHEGDLWVYFRDDDGTVTHEELLGLVNSILDYAKANAVRVVMYPHFNNVYPTAADAYELVEEIDDPSFGLAINLTHELMSQKGDELAETFALVEDRIVAAIISGADAQLDPTDMSSLIDTTINSLDESSYDLRPYMELLAASGYEGPVSFLNFHLENPEDYLERSMQTWMALCEEVGLWDPAR